MFHTPISFCCFTFIACNNSNHSERVTCPPPPHCTFDRKAVLFHFMLGGYFTMYPVLYVNAKTICRSLCFVRNLYSFAHHSPRKDSSALLSHEDIDDICKVNLRVIVKACRRGGREKRANAARATQNLSFINKKISGYFIGLINGISTSPSRDNVCPWCLLNPRQPSTRWCNLFTIYSCHRER